MNEHDEDRAWEREQRFMTHLETIVFFIVFRALPIIAVAALIFLIAGCGGGGGSTSSAGPEPAPEDAGGFHDDPPYILAEGDYDYGYFLGGKGEGGRSGESFVRQFHRHTNLTWVRMRLPVTDGKRVPCVVDDGSLPPNANYITGDGPAVGGTTCWWEEEPFFNTETWRWDLSTPIRADRAPDRFRIPVPPEHSLAKVIRLGGES